MIIKTKAYGICLYKKTPHYTKVLLCKSINSKEKWGFVKGVQDPCESNEETAVREFFEETAIEVNQIVFENYFEQENEQKDIGIYMVNCNRIKYADKYFINDKLIKHFLSWENSEIRFFDIDKLPIIKKKQYKIANNIIQYLKKEK